MAFTFPREFTERMIDNELDFFPWVKAFTFNVRDGVIRNGSLDAFRLEGAHNGEMVVGIQFGECGTRTAYVEHATYYEYGGHGERMNIEWHGNLAYLRPFYFARRC